MLTVDGCVFERHTGAGEASALRARTNNLITVANSRFANNTSTANFGAAVFTGFSGPGRVSVFDSQFEDNAGGCLAAGIQTATATAAMANVTVARCTFRRCAKAGTADSDLLGVGAAIRAVLAAGGSPPPSLDVSESLLEGNTAFSAAEEFTFGGALAVRSDPGSSATAAISRCTFAGNSARTNSNAAAVGACPAPRARACGCRGAPLRLPVRAARARAAYAASDCTLLTPPPPPPQPAPCSLSTSRPRPSPKAR